MTTQLLTTADAARELGISERGVRKLVERNRLKAMRAGSFLLFSPAVIKAAKSRRGPGRPVTKEPANPNPTSKT